MVGGEESSSWRREAVVGGESNELVGGERSAVVGWREESSGWMEIGEQCLDGERSPVMDVGGGRTVTGIFSMLLTLLLKVRGKGVV